MTTWTVGNLASWSLEVRDASGTLADLGGGNPSASVLLPDATLATATVTKTGTGIYRADLLTTQAGRHLITWTGSGTNSGALPYVDLADVWPADPRMIVGLSDARAALNTLSTSRINDDELRGYLVAATVVIESLCGPQLRATRIERHTGGRPALALSDIPVSITSVVEDGVTLTASDYALDVGAVLWRGSTRGGARWSGAGVGNIAVTYAVGGSVLPQNVVLAAAHLVAHWWRQTQQSPRPMLGAPAGEPGLPMVAGYAVPNIVTDLLAPSDVRLPGLA